ncbi:hypothetical protein M422DRAFT_31826 [Sphaerobolus stellatus SS14]|uniref:Uncharacterized protein n=1 Tax=Sphaerobolus stellatus (strain SS14) TaxID=990650 RepID=A0A0C9VT02_SPHS4|nr:hypothetical protein M422DRAFT_31826 [Sphaerobolus stellatus SS14]
MSCFGRPPTALHKCLFALGLGAPDEVVVKWLPNHLIRPKLQHFPATSGRKIISGGYLTLLLRI